MLTSDQTSDDEINQGLPVKKDKVIQPLYEQIEKPEHNPQAVELIRNKLSALYEDEPDAKIESSETEATAAKNRSKHQKFMHVLSTSGRPLADIQTAWHEYYTNLPDNEKHEVWQEFYTNYSNKAHPSVTPAKMSSNAQLEDSKEDQAPELTKKPSRLAKFEPRSVAEIRQSLTGKVYSNAQKRKHHIKSLVFGLSMGGLTLFIMLFGFFNERFIAPFITPSRNVGATPIIVSAGEDIGKEPKIIIPKINVEIPVVYDEPSIEEATVQNALERGVVHYATTVQPGEKGNGVIFGHSSNNILNRGKYKFAFVLLNRLREGDTFMLHKNGVRYVYKVYKRTIVPPTDLSVLDKQEKASTFSLITCDPPGTSINRLVVVGEQISPDPSSNKRSSVTETKITDPNILPSNAPSLWDRLTSWL